MKRFAFLLGVFAILFASCSAHLSENKTSITIQLPSAREISTRTDSVCDVEVSLSIDGVVQMQTGTISTFTGSTFTFSNIEIGTRAVASCEVISNNIAIWQGKSDTVTVTEGINIPIGMKSLVFTQEEFRTIMSNYKTNTSTIFEIPKGYTKIIGVNKGVNADGSPNMESVFADWAAIVSESSTYGNMPTIKIPASVVYIDAAAFCGLKDEYGYPSVQIEFEDSYGWVYTGKRSQYTTNEEQLIDVEDYYSPYFREYIYNLIEGYGYIRKLNSLNVEFPIVDAQFFINVLDENGKEIFTYNNVLPIGTTVIFEAEIGNYDVGADDSATIVPKSYKWYVDGTLNPNETSRIFIWNTSNVPSGVHEIMCVVNEKLSAFQEIRIGTR